MERSRVRIPAGAAGEFSSPGPTFCTDFYFGIRSTPVLPQLQLITHAPYVCGFAFTFIFTDFYSIALELKLFGVEKDPRGEERTRLLWTK